MSPSIVCSKLFQVDYANAYQLSYALRLFINILFYLFIIYVDTLTETFHRLIYIMIRAYRFKVVLCIINLKMYFKSYMLINLQTLKI